MSSQFKQFWETFNKGKKFEKPREMVPYFENLFRNKYHLNPPKMTVVSDGIYIYGVEMEGRLYGGKIFINIDDANADLPFQEIYLENAHDGVIHALEDKNRLKKFWQQRFEKKLDREDLESVRFDIKRLQDKGMISSKIIDYLQRSYPSNLSERWQAERVYWTETKRMESLMIANDAEDLGIKYFRILPNANACRQCRQFSQDGTKIFTQDQLIKDGKPIVPIHPGCYCLILPLPD
jgi:hypothetical protein